jgi:hypothetical protein
MKLEYGRKINICSDNKKWLLGSIRNAVRDYTCPTLRRAESNNQYLDIPGRAKKARLTVIIEWE